MAVLTPALDLGSEGLGTVQVLGELPTSLGRHILSMKWSWTNTVIFFFFFSTEDGDVGRYLCSCLEILSYSPWSHTPSRCEYLCTVKDVPDGGLLHETSVKAGEG